MKTFPATEAKNKFGDLLDEAAKKPVRIEKNGKPVAYVLSQHDFEAVENMLPIARVRVALQQGDAAILQALNDFAAGKITRARALELLDLTYYGDLLDALSLAGLEPKGLPDRVTHEMAEGMAKLIRG